MLPFLGMLLLATAAPSGIVMVLLVVAVLLCFGSGYHFGPGPGYYGGFGLGGILLILLILLLLGII